MAVSVTVILLMLVYSLSAYPTGAPVAKCGDMTPGHGTKNDITNSPYTVTASRTTFKAGDSMTVTVSGTGGATFKGFFLQARLNGTIIGSFSNLSPTNSTKTITCATANDAATHADRTIKNTITATWTAPRGLLSTTGNMVFVSTVVTDFDTVWIQVPSTALTYEADGTGGAGNIAGMGSIVLTLLSALLVQLIN
ncbi:unnamed protein product [Owenia fusiformis]|uniref:Reelin domain-containing protein n=1 Tax=Owenia fusiformis TaxID=6347 RepID=A0A8S4PC86_OWEFU|nr:unnamed protein product [Owenia fusiformis]